MWLQLCGLFKEIGNTQANKHTPEDENTQEPWPSLDSTGESETLPLPCFYPMVRAMEVVAAHVCVNLTGRRLAVNAGV